MTNLRYWMDKNHIKELELANRIGVSLSTVYRILSGQRPSPIVAKMIAKEMNVKEWEILDERPGRFKRRSILG